MSSSESDDHSLFHDKDRAAEENSLLELSKDVLLALGSARKPPVGVVWVGTKNFYPDNPVLMRGRQLGLRWELRGKLSVQEWRPLMTSSFLIQTRMGKKNLVIDRVVPIFLAFFLFGVILYVLFTRFYYLPLGGPRSGAWVIFLLAGLLYLCGRMMGPFRRALRFQADEIVSSEFGMRNELVLALQKIGGLSLSEKGYLAGVSSQATVAQRIDKLSRMK